MALSLIELFLVIFFLLFFVILLYVVCRRFCSSLSPATGEKLDSKRSRRNTDPSDPNTINGNNVSVSGSGSPLSGTDQQVPNQNRTRNQAPTAAREARNSVPRTARRQNNIQSIYLGTRNELTSANINSTGPSSGGIQVGGVGSRSIYTIPVRTSNGEVRRASVIVLHNLNSLRNSIAPGQNIRVIQIHNQQQQQQIPQSILEELPPSYDECIEVDIDSDSEDSPRYLPPPPYSPFPTYNIV